MKVILINPGHGSSRSVELGRWSRALLSLCCLGLPLGLVAAGYLAGLDSEARSVRGATLDTLQDELERQSGDFEDLQGVTCIRPNRESDFELFKHRWKLATERIFGDDPPQGIPWQKLNANVHVTGYRIAGADVLIVHQVYDEKLTILLGWRPVQ